MHISMGGESVETNACGIGRGSICVCAVCPGDFTGTAKRYIGVVLRMETADL